MDKCLDEKAKIQILKQCGRRYQLQSFIDNARKIYQKSQNIDEFLDNLGKVYENLHRIEDKVYITYPKCYCPNINKIPKGNLSATYCNCSRRWAKALFEGALERPVEVIKDKSIINGDEECKFHIILC